MAHILGILYVALVGFQVFIDEFQNEKFVFYYYNQEVPAAHSDQTFIIPLAFFIITIFFGILFYLIKIEDSLKLIFPKILLSSFLVYGYILLLTLQAENTGGAFFWPVQNVDFQYKAEYCEVIILLLFLGFYFFILKSCFFGNRALGNFIFFILYSPLISLIYSNEAATHIALIIYASLIFICSKNLDFTPMRKIFTNYGIQILLISTVGIAFIFRLWTLQHLENIGLRNIPGFAADGPHSYQAALGFFSNQPIYSVVPYSYSLLFFFFLKIASLNLVKALTIQCLIISFTPLVTFFICRTVFNLKTAIIVSICSVLSYELLHFSVIVHRTGLASFFLIVYILVLIKSTNNLKASYGAISGFLIGWTILLEGFLAPIAILSLVPIFHNPTKKIVKFLCCSLLGLLIAEIIFNYYILGIYDEIMPLGRKLQNTVSWFSNWINGNHAISIRIKEMGFNPFDFPKKSLGMFLESPIEIGGLIIMKFFYEIRAYFLGHNSIFLDPFLLNQNSFFASSLQLFYIPIILLGLVGLVFSKRINWQYKVILVIPFLYHFLFHTVVIYSYARYRGIILPLLIIYFSYSLFLVFEYLFNFKDTVSNQNTKSGEQTLLPQNNILRWLLLSLSIIVAATGLIFEVINSTTHPFSKKEKVTTQLGQRVLWRDQSFSIQNKLLNTPDQTLNYFIKIDKTSQYNISVKLAKKFGPSIWTQKLEFYINNLLVGERLLPSRSGWTTLKNIDIKKGRHKLSIKALHKKRELSSFSLGSTPDLKPIKLMEIIVSRVIGE